MSLEDDGILPSQIKSVKTKEMFVSLSNVTILWKILLLQHFKTFMCKLSFPFEMTRAD